jgi:acid phosphatase type 7
MAPPRIVAVLATVAALGSAAASPSARTSLLGSPFSDVLAARARLSAALAASDGFAPPAPSAGAGRVSLTILSPAVPTGVAAARVDWSVPAGYELTGSPAWPFLTLHCAGGADADIIDAAPLPAAQGAGATELRLPAVGGCDYEARILVVTTPPGAPSVGAAPVLLAALPATAVVSVAARSGAVPVLSADTDPVGTRLAFGDAPGDVLVTWTSMNATAPAFVRVGTTAGGPYPLTFGAPAAPVTYREGDLCHAPANESSVVSYLFPGWFYTVPVTGLAPGATYFAVYGQDGGTVAPEVSFRTRLPPGPDVPVRFAAFGDSATYPVFPGTVTTVDLVLAEHAEGGGLNFTAVIGDLGYAEGSTLVWALWTGFVWPVASAMPFQVTVGNHETNCATCFGNNVSMEALWQGPFPLAFGDDSGGEGGFPTFARYRAPPASPGHGVFWYSFDVGSVHFALLSSEHDYTAGSAQRAWIAADLAAVDRATTPWVVVGLHRPVYNSYNDSDWNIAVAAAAQLEPLFVQHSVDLVLSGHYHSWLRTTSVRNFTVDPTGASPVYVTVGTGGATYHNETVRSGAGAWTAAGGAEWGFGIVEAFNRSALRWTFHSNAAGGAVHDEAWILRPGRGAVGERAVPAAPPPSTSAPAPAGAPLPPAPTRPSAPHAPEQIHLTLHSDPDTLVATWTSFEAVAGPAPPLVQSGPVPGALNRTSAGTAWVYPVDTCPGNSTRAMHTVAFAAPRHADTYYRVSGDNGTTWSPVLGPVRAPSVRDDGSVAVSLFGDMGINTAPAPNSVAALANDTRDGLHDLIIHFGDSCYNCDDECGAVGDAFLNAAQAYSALTPTVYGNGNHEGGPLKQYSEFVNRLAPGQAALSAAANSTSTRWVSWSIPGCCAFFMIDTDAWIYPLVWPLAGPQWDWLQSRVALINRTETPWVVVIGHRAMYCTKTDDGECNSEAETLRYGQLEQFWGLESLLVAAGADFYFAGHTHHYEACWPVREGTATQTDYVNPRATVHIQSGIAGTGPGGDPFAVPQQPWERFRDESYSPSYGRLVFVNASVAVYTQYFAENRSVLDTMTVVQERHGPF